MMYYSIKTQGFYPDELLVNFDKNIDTPEDLRVITDENYNQFFNPPAGYHSVFDELGPRIEKNQAADFLSIAESTKQSILDAIPSKISVYQTKLFMGRTLTDEEKEDLNAWLDYSDKVNAIDTSTAPNITWPTSPDDESTTT